MSQNDYAAWQREMEFRTLTIRSVDDIVDTNSTSTDSNSAHGTDDVAEELIAANNDITTAAGRNQSKLPIEVGSQNHKSMNPFPPNTASAIDSRNTRPDNIQFSNVHPVDPETTSPAQNVPFAVTNERPKALPLRRLSSGDDRRRDPLSDNVERNGGKMSNSIQRDNEIDDGDDLEDNQHQTSCGIWNSLGCGGGKSSTVGWKLRRHQSATTSPPSHPQVTSATPSYSLPSSPSNGDSNHSGTSGDVTGGKLGRDSVRDPAVSFPSTTPASKLRPNAAITDVDDFVSGESTGCPSQRQHSTSIGKEVPDDSRKSKNDDDSPFDLNGKKLGDVVYDILKSSDDANPQPSSACHECDKQPNAGQIEMQPFESETNGSAQSEQSRTNGLVNDCDIVSYSSKEPGAEHVPQGECAGGRGIKAYNHPRRFRSLDGETALSPLTSLSLSVWNSDAGSHTKVDVAGSAGSVDSEGRSAASVNSSAAVDTDTGLGVRCAAAADDDVPSCGNALPPRAVRSRKDCSNGNGSKRTGKQQPLGEQSDNSAAACQRYYRSTDVICSRVTISGSSTPGSREESQQSRWTRCSRSAERPVPSPLKSPTSPSTPTTEARGRSTRRHRAAAANDEDGHNRSPIRRRSLSREWKVVVVTIEENITIVKPATVSRARSPSPATGSKLTEQPQESPSAADSVSEQTETSSHCPLETYETQRLDAMDSLNGSETSFSTTPETKNVQSQDDDRNSVTSGEAPPDELLTGQSEEKICCESELRECREDIQNDVGHEVLNSSESDDFDDKHVVEISNDIVPVVVADNFASNSETDSESSPNLIACNVCDDDGHEIVNDTGFDEVMTSPQVTADPDDVVTHAGTESKVETSDSEHNDRNEHDELQQLAEQSGSMVDEWPSVMSTEDLDDHDSVTKENSSRATTVVFLTTDDRISTDNQTDSNDAPASADTSDDTMSVTNDSGNEEPSKSSPYHSLPDLTSSEDVEQSTTTAFSNNDANNNVDDSDRVEDNPTSYGLRRRGRKPSNEIEDEFTDSSDDVIGGACAGARSPVAEEGFEAAAAENVTDNSATGSRPRGAEADDRNPTARQPEVPARRSWFDLEVITEKAFIESLISSLGTIIFLLAAALIFHILNRFVEHEYGFGR